jgi:hypothetical protein
MNDFASEPEKLQSAQLAACDRVLRSGDLTKQSFQNSPAPRGAPIYQFLHVRAFSPASFKQVVRVNVDTLYSSAFLDLSEEAL